MGIVPYINFCYYPTMEKIKGIIFDMDGVLLDSESISDITWEAAGKDFNIPMTMEILNSCRGSNRDDIMATLKKHFGPDFDSYGFLERTGKYFWQIEEEKGIPLMPYAKEILAYLAPKYEMALASSTKGESVTRHLTKVGIVEYFNKRITGDMVTHSKPDPEIYLRACELIKLNPSECVAIEDSLNGVRSSYAAGIRTIMIPDRVQPTEEIKPMCWKICNTLADLKDLL